MKKRAIAFILVAAFFILIPLPGYALSMMDINFYELFEQTDSIMLLINPKTGEIVHANKAAAKFYGYTKEQLERMTIKDINILPPEETDKEMHSAIEGRKNYFVFKHQLASGEIRTVEVYSNPYIGDGKTILFSTVYDITANTRLTKLNRIITGVLIFALLGIVFMGVLFNHRVSKDNGTLEKLNETLTKSKNDLRLLLDSTVEGIYGIDLNGNCTFCNKSCLSMLGYKSEDELIGKNMHNKMHYKRLDGTDIPLNKCPVHSAFLKGEGAYIEGEIAWRADGTFFPTEYRSHPQCRNGNVIGAVVTFNDTTERKRAQDEIMDINEQLRAKQYSLEEQNALIEELNAQLEEENLRNLQQKETLQAIVDSLGAGVIMTNSTGEVVFINKAWKELFDYTDLGQPQHFCEGFYIEYGSCSKAEDFLKNTLEGIVNKEAEAVKLKSLIGDHEKRYAVDFEQTSPVKRFLNLYSNPCTSHTGHNYGRIFAVRDVSHQKEIENIKSELISTVSHELRTPMSSLLGFSELLLTRDISEERRKEYIRIMNSEAQRLTKLINDFLDIQRMESGQGPPNRQKYRLNQIIEEAIKRFGPQDEKHKIIYSDKSDMNSIVCCDKNQIMQTFSNILSNAIKFSPKGGDIRIDIDKNIRSAKVSITDSGLGIPERAKEKLFTKFYRINDKDRKEIGGTGLGLAICKEIIRAHGGRIDFDSIEGKGSTFYFTLPLWDAGQKCTPKDV